MQIPMTIDPDRYHQSNQGQNDECYTYADAQYQAVVFDSVIVV